MTPKGKSDRQSWYHKQRLHRPESQTHNEKKQQARQIKIAHNKSQTHIDNTKHKAIWSKCLKLRGDRESKRKLFCNGRFSLLRSNCNTSVVPTAGIGKAQIWVGIYKFSNLIVSFHSFLQFGKCAHPPEKNKTEKCAWQPLSVSNSYCKGSNSNCDSIQCDFVQHRSLHLLTPNWRWLLL